MLFQRNLAKELPKSSKKEEQIIGKDRKMKYEQNSSQNNSPLSAKNLVITSESLHDFLPNDLIDRIETISPLIKGKNSKNDSLSNLSSYSKSESMDEEEEDGDYNNLKFYSNNPMVDISRTNQNLYGKKSFCNNDISSFKNMQNNFMQNINNIFDRKNSLQNCFIFNNIINNLNINNDNNNINKKTTKKKNKKNKKKIKPNDDEYITEMFGKKGWICKQCSNFNYLTRNKCNRCGIIKMPKSIKNKDSSYHDGDWKCPFCNNVNYGFRLICNRCQNKKTDIKDINTENK